MSNRAWPSGSSDLHLCHLRCEEVNRPKTEGQPGRHSITASGGSTAAEELKSEGTKDVGWLIAQAEQAFDAGADIIMIESEGITENVKTWRTDVVARIINRFGLEKVMFEGANPPVFEWYVKNYSARIGELVH